MKILTSKIMKPKIILILGPILLGVVILISFLIGAKRTGPDSTIQKASLLWKREALPKSGIPVRDTAVPMQTPSASGKLDASLRTAVLQDDAGRREQLLTEWAFKISLDQMEKALAEIRKIEKPELQFQARNALFARWMARDISGMTGWFGNRYAADAEHQQAREALVRHFVQQDPAKAMSWMQRSLPELVRKELYPPFFRQWALKDPAAAGAQLLEQAVTSTEQANQWKDLTAQVAGVWAGINLAKASHWVQSLPQGDVKSRALMQIGYEWAKKDPQAAAAYAFRQQDMSMMNVALSTWAESNPSAAASYARGLPGKLAQDQAALTVITRWAATAPTQAAEWIGQFPEDSFKGKAFTQLMTQWTEQDAKGAANWMKTLPQNPSRDRAVAAYSGGVAPQDPVAAFQWAKTISDQTLREQNLRMVAATWIAQDPNTAKAQIGGSNLPADLKRELLLTPATLN